MEIGEKVVTVPADFPRESDIASVAGVQPKLAVTRDAVSGKYVAHRGNDEIAARFSVCDDLAEQLANKCARNRNGKYQHLSEREILDQLLNRLLASGWGNPAEMNWTASRTAEKLGWLWSPGQLP